MSQDADNHFSSRKISLIDDIVKQMMSSIAMNIHSNISEFKNDAEFLNFQLSIMSSYIVTHLLSLEMFFKPVFGDQAQRLKLLENIYQKLKNTLNNLKEK